MSAVEWWAWMAKYERARGRTDDATRYDAWADEHARSAEREAAQVAKHREFARQWRAAGGDEALATRYDEAAAAVPAPYTWPPGATRALAERLALELYPGAPVELAPDAFLAGIWLYMVDARPELIAQVMATPANAPLPAAPRTEPRTDRADVPTLTEQLAAPAPAPAPARTVADTAGVSRYRTTAPERPAPTPTRVAKGQTQAHREHVAEAARMAAARRRKARER